MKIFFFFFNIYLRGTEGGKVGCPGARGREGFGFGKKRMLGAESAEIERQRSGHLLPPTEISFYIKHFHFRIFLCPPIDKLLSLPRNFTRLLLAKMINK